MRPPTDQPLHVLHNHTTWSVLDGASTVQEYVDFAKLNGLGACGICDHGYALGLHDLITTCHKEGIKPIPGCLVAGQEIVTSKGAKSVEDVCVGDFVLTHKGRFRRVLRTMSHEYEGDMFTFYPSKASRGVTLTPEHPVLISDGSDVVKWVRADQVEVGLKNSQLAIDNYKSYACLPRLAHKYDSIDFGKYTFKRFDYEKGYAVKKYKSHPSDSFNEWQKIWRHQVLDAEFAYFLGLFVAEGHVAESRNGQAGLTFHKHEDRYANFITNFLFRRFGIKVQQYLRAERGSLSLEFCCLPFSEFLGNACGVGAENKRIPVEIMNGSEEAKRSFMEGLLNGDGKNPQKTKNIKKTRELSSVSKDLVWQLRSLLAHFGQWSTVNTKNEAGKGFSVTTNKRAGKVKKVINRQKAYQIFYSENATFRRSIEVENYLLKPISRVVKEHRKCMVYNFEVEEDNSYVSDFILHNCEFYLAPRPDYVFVGKPYDYGHISLWAQNQEGYQSLLSLASRSWLPDRVVKKWGKPKPRITWDDLSTYNSNLICGSGCIEGPIAKPMLRGEVEEAITNAAILNEIFGDRLYFEVMPHAVDRNYCKDAVITVKDDRGGTYTFLPTDMVDTPSGRISIQEAMALRVTEIWNPTPNRFQERPILDPGSEPERFLDQTDLSVLLSSPHDDASDDTECEFASIRNLQTPPTPDENQSSNMDADREDFRRHRMLSNP